MSIDDAAGRFGTQTHNVVQEMMVGSWYCILSDDLWVVSPYWQLLLGREIKTEAMLSKADWLSLVHPDDVQHQQAVWSRHVQGLSRCYQCIFRMRHADGQWVTVIDQGVLGVGPGGMRGEAQVTGFMLRMCDDLARQISPFVFARPALDESGLG